MRNSAAAVLLSVASWAAADCQSDVIPWPEGSGDLFGSGIAGDSGRIVVGVPDAALGGLFEHGRVLISNTGGVLVELPMPPQESGLLVGSDVTLSDGYAFASCTGRTDGFNGNVGGVLFWEQLSADTWSSPQLLSRPDWDDQFFGGYQIAASDGVLVVSVPGLVGGYPAAAGALDVWTLGGADGYSYAGRLSGGSESGSFFGAALDINASLLVVGAPTTGAGRVHIYDRSGDSFSYRGFLEGVSEGDQFGASVSLHGSTLFVGAPRVGPGNVGEAYRYSIQTGLPAANMTYEAPEGASPNSRFGLSIAGDDFHVCATGLLNGRAAIWRADVVEGLPDSMITDGFVGRIRDVYADGDGRFYLPDEFSGDVKVLNPRLDCNLNGICDPDEEGPDCNNNGIPDVPCDVVTIGDCNNNDIPDDCESDCDMDGEIDACDDDDDGDGILDVCDADSCGSTGTDCNGNGILDSCDIDDGAEDCDGNGIPDSCDVSDGSKDCNGNGIPDSCDIEAGAEDCDENGIPDSCDIEAGAEDCDTNGIPDVCDIKDGAPDCNANGIPDGCEDLPDCDSNGIPDECELKGNDCDGNGVLDDCQDDCDVNGIPDACEVDCNGDGVPDNCQSLPDCNRNGTPDECELKDNDCDKNGVPDECDLADGAADCNDNSVLDVCDIAQGLSQDCNGNAIPDECDIGEGTSGDCDKNSIPDECDLADGGADCNANGVLDVCDLNEGKFEDCNANGVPDDCDLGLPGGGGIINLSFEEFLGSDQLVLDSQIEGLEFVGSNQNAPWTIRDATSGSYNLSSWDCMADSDTGNAWGEANYWICDEVAVTTALDKTGNDGEIILPFGASFFELQYSSVSELFLIAYDESGLEIDRDSQPGNLRSGGNESGPGHLRVSAKGAGRIASVRVTDSGNYWIVDSFVTDALYQGSEFDCDGNMHIDSCEIEANPELDCDKNGVLDVCDVLQPKADCNMNGIPDACDVSSGFSDDCDGNNQPDECQLLEGSAFDCNENDVLDVCEIEGGALDQNGNMVPDDCECIEDLTTDGFVDLLDVVVILGQWMTSPGGLPDINGDGMVDLQDLLLVLDAYGPCEL